MKVAMRMLTVVAFAALAAIFLTTAFHLEAAAQDEPGALPGQTSLRLNELMSSNGTTLFDPDEPDEAPDWIELYNPTANPVSLVGIALTDDPAAPDKHVITQSLTISPNGFLILYADNDPEQGAAHLDFALSADGEYLGLSIINDGGTFTLLDEIQFPALPRDLSYARRIDGTGTWEITRPTPGKSNSSNPPWITGVTTPTVDVNTPAPLGPVQVTATITDDVSVASATLVYLTDTAPYSTGASVWVRVPMASLGGNQYQQEIPAVAAGTLVKYYVEAEDNAGDSSRWPRLGREYAYMAGYQPPLLLINKVVARNTDVPDPDEPAETPDWIELYNPGASPVSLDGLTITNDSSEPVKFRIPAGITIPARGLLTFLADSDAGQNTIPGHKAWHMNFNLNADGDFIALYGGEGTAVVDAFDWDDPAAWGAFGRAPNGGTWSDQVCAPRMTAANVVCAEGVFVPFTSR